MNEFTGKVSLVYPTIDAATRTFPVEIKLDNKDMRVRPGMFARVTINFGTERQCRIARFGSRKANWFRAIVSLRV